MPGGSGGGCECHIARRCQEKGAHSLRAHGPPVMAPGAVAGGQGNTQEAGNQGRIAWRLEPGCVGLNPGCVALDGSVALSELQLHLKVGRIAERPGFPTLKETSRH